MDSRILKSGVGMDFVCVRSPPVEARWWCFTASLLSEQARKTRFWYSEAQDPPECDCTTDANGVQTNSESDHDFRILARIWSIGWICWRAVSVGCRVWSGPGLLCVGNVFPGSVLSIWWYTRGKTWKTLVWSRRTSTNKSISTRDFRIFRILQFRISCLSVTGVDANWADRDGSESVPTSSMCYKHVIYVCFR